MTASSTAHAGMSAEASRWVPSVRLGIPAYFAPAGHPGEWSRLLQSAPGTTVVVNPDSGPARGMRRAYATSIRRLRARDVNVYGYVDVDYGRRTLCAIMRDAMRYRCSIGVNGVFLDQAPAEPGPMRRLGRLAPLLRLLGTRVAVNPGRDDLASDAFDRFDDVVVFEGDWTSYRECGPRLTRRTASRANVWHLVHGVPRDRLRDTVLNMGAFGADVGFATPGVLPNPWLAMPIELAGVGAGPAADRPALLGDAPSTSRRTRL